jgi:MFS family permease
VNPLTVPAFRRFLAMRTCSMLAAQVQLTALGWWVYRETGDPLDLAWVGLAQFAPVLALSLPAGHAADRFERRRILGGCQLAMVVVNAALAAVAAAGNPSTAVLVGFCLAMGTVRAFSNPAGQALLPTLVPHDGLQRALAMSSTLFQLCTIAGPSLGGLLLAAGGAVPAFLGAVALLLAALALLVGLPSVHPPAAGRSLDDLLAGLRYVRDQRLILACTTLDLFAVLLGGATALLPVYAADVLHVDPRGYGLLRAAPAFGAAAVAVGFAWRPLRGRLGPKMLLGVAGFGLGTVVFGLSESVPLSVAALAFLGAADMVSVVVRQTLVQLHTPDAMRGRVSAVNQVFISASNELGEFESGVAARLVGAVPAVVLGGLGTLAVTGLWAWRFPELRTAEVPRTPA